jgi:hypothetical protein
MSARSSASNTPVLTGFLLCAGALFSIGFPMIGRAQPKAVLSDTLVVMGEIYHNAKATRSLTLRNTGSMSLHVVSVRSSCGCTVAGISKSEISPADSAELSFTVNTAILSGKVRKNIVVETNDPARPVLSLYYEAEIINILTSVPAFLYLGEGEIHTEISGVLRLTNTTKNPIHILGVGSASGKLKCSTLPAVMAPGDSAKLTVSFTPDAAGTMKDELRIETDQTVQKTVRIGVAGRVRMQK